MSFRNLGGVSCGWWSTVFGAPQLRNKQSNLLSPEENLQVFRLLGSQFRSLSTTPVQLFFAEPPPLGWVKKQAGVLCFVKDQTSKKYFFKLVSLELDAVTWEHEMDEDIDYVETKYYFHTFEGHDNKMAFSFASADEAKVFKRRVEEKVRFKRRAEERTVTRGRVAEAGIGSPTDFKQITHVSLDPVSGFVVDTVEHDVKCVFQKAGIEQPPDKSKQELRNRETDEMRLGRGGPSSNERRFGRVIPRPRSPPPPAPAMKKSSPPVYGSSSPIYEPPPSIYELPPSLPPVDYPRNRASLRKSLSSRALPAIPAKRCASVESIKSKSSICRPSCPPPPPPVSSNPRSTSPPPPPSIPRPPPPVFLPPPPPTSPPPPVSPPSKQCPSSSSACRTMSASLLESIKTGVALKAVPKKEASPLDLLGDIRKGIKLKPVGEREEKPCKVSSRPDMLEALSKVLAARSAKIHSEDDADDESTSNDEAWQEGE